MKNKPNIVFKDNNCSKAEFCTSCKEEFEPEIGQWPFIDGDYSRPICKNCLNAEQFIQYSKEKNREFEPNEYEKVIRAITKHLNSDQFLTEMRGYNEK